MVQSFCVLIKPVQNTRTYIYIYTYIYIHIFIYEIIWSIFEIVDPFPLTSLHGACPVESAVALSHLRQDTGVDAAEPDGGTEEPDAGSGGHGSLWLYITL